MQRGDGGPDAFGLGDIGKIQSDIKRALGGDSPAAPPAFAAFPDHRPAADGRRGEPRARTAVLVFLACTLGTGTLGFGIGAGLGRAGGAPEVPAQGAPGVFESVSFSFDGAGGQPVASLPDMLEMVKPSVVAISAHRPGDSDLPAVSHASGVIFAEDDDTVFIATSRFAVREAQRWEVVVGGAGPFPAFPVAFDAFTDLAVAGVLKDDLLEAGVGFVVIAAFGESGAMRVGDAVMAIGNAMGDGISVTRGIVSAAEAEFAMPHGSPAFPVVVLQTDAAINAGNSGGALVNMRGEVVGITVSHATGVFGSSPVEGMGYATASDFAVPVLERLLFSPFPLIGIQGRSLTAAAAAELGMPPLGALVTAVYPGTPADAAGILVGDVITAINGRPLTDLVDLQRTLRSMHIGDTVELNVVREGSLMVKRLLLTRAVIDNF